MDGDLWAARLSAAKRHHSLQQSHAQHQWDRLSIDDFEPEDDVRPEFPCPYCYEDFDISTLCSHVEDEHLFESKGVACPVCAAKVGKDVVGHITLQHGHLFKMQRRRRCRRAGVPPGATLSLLGKELREAHLQVLLGGGAFRSSGGSSSNNADSLLSALMYNFPIPEADDLVKQNTSGEENFMRQTPLPQYRRTSSEVSLSAEEREQKMKQASLRAKFVQQLVISTLVEDS